MAKINIKNSDRNSLISYIKEKKLSFSTTERRSEGNQVIEKIKISTSKGEDKRQIANIVRDYGTQLYHNATFRDDMKLNNVFMYSSNDYESTIIGKNELELPNFYIENTNEQNEDYSNLKALATNKTTKEYIKNLSSRQTGLVAREATQLLKFKNIVFGNNYSSPRSNSNLNEFPYYNSVKVISGQDDRFMSSLMKRIYFQEEILGGLLSEQQSVDVNFDINGAETTVPVKDFFDVLNNSLLELGVEDKIILGTRRQNSNFMISNFKKNIIKAALYENISGVLPSFTEMHDSIEVQSEVLVYRVDKFIDNDSQPIQTFWMYDADEYQDYQIKRNQTYKYKLSCYCLLYGIETRIIDVKENRGNMEVTIASTPSYKYTQVDFADMSALVSPKIPMPPFASFHNETNEENKIKIYLSLKNESSRGRFIPITEEDIGIMSGLELEDDVYDFGYEVQDGKFEVFRLSEKPKSYRDFDGSKILEVRNNISTTDVIFKENIQPNKKYYFMFRSVNFIGVPSNPSPIYEVEHIKMASQSKVETAVVLLDKKIEYADKTFKRLIQVKPAFQQDIFDDQDDRIQELETFKKNIGDLTLGTATDRVWGKKFKIRIKSKDSGKIIDLNVKFNLIKDNIK
jgi:hypothetical protein